MKLSVLTEKRKLKNTDWIKNVSDWNTRPELKLKDKNVLLEKNVSGKLERRRDSEELKNTMSKSDNKTSPSSLKMNAELLKPSREPKKSDLRELEEKKR